MSRALVLSTAVALAVLQSADDDSGAPRGTEVASALPALLPEKHRPRRARLAPEVARVLRAALAEGGHAEDCPAPDANGAPCVCWQADARALLAAG